MKPLGILLSFAVVAVAIYFAAYALKGRRVSFLDWQTGAIYWGMGYDEVWEAKLFVPAAATESFVCKHNVATGTRTELTWRSPTH
jgi:hypothetical protein